MFVLGLVLVFIDRLLSAYSVFPVPHERGKEGHLAKERITSYTSLFVILYCLSFY